MSEVQKIHDLCRGHPLSIALFGSQIATFKERLVDTDFQIWKHFIEMLQTNYVYAFECTLFNSYLFISIFFVAINRII